MKRINRKRPRSLSDHAQMIVDDAARFSEDSRYYKATMGLYDRVPRAVRDDVKERGGKALVEFYEQLRKNPQFLPREWW